MGRRPLCHHVKSKMYREVTRKLENRCIGQKQSRQQTNTPEPRKLTKLQTIPGFVGSLRRCIGTFLDVLLIALNGSCCYATVKGASGFLRKPELTINSVKMDFWAAWLRAILHCPPLGTYMLKNETIETHTHPLTHTHTHTHRYRHGCCRINFCYGYHHRYSHSCDCRLPEDIYHPYLQYVEIAYLLGTICYLLDLVVRFWRTDSCWTPRYPLPMS
eukprot:6349343-Amphidinium_carterae.1